MRQWNLKIEFNTVVEQVERDPENVFPFDDLSRFIAYITDYWGMLPEELHEGSLVEWYETSVILHPEVLDNIVEPMNWLLMHTIPKSLALTR